MKQLVAFVMIAFLVPATATVAFAKNPCKEDKAKFCKDAKAGGKGKVTECLTEHKAELTPAGVKEQALVLGMLAGLALGEADAVQARETRWAATVPMGTLADSRRFLRAWESGGETVCAAAQAKR